MVCRRARFARERRRGRAMRCPPPWRWALRGSGAALKREEFLTSCMSPCGARRRAFFYVAVAGFPSLLVQDAQNAQGDPDDLLNDRCHLHVDGHRGPPRKSYTKDTRLAQ